MALDPAQVEKIFWTAVGKPTPQERAAYIDEACGDNVELRKRIEQLLRAHQNPDSIFDATVAPPDSSSSDRGPDETPGTMIGPYKLLQPIGEGGFGIVWMAEQEKPLLRRVAVKIMKLGMDTRQVIARFEAERQALAMMDHPNIARVFDAGASSTGRPYFVMELVKGIPITEYCDQTNLNITQRLELFVQVCQAVQHAHQKGLIHRDIKPSNILVNTQDDRPCAKVIDFGIAKATQSRLTEKTLFTEFRQLIGTPEYMSPEQAGGSLDIDTRSDVYSLGVLLYELLTGGTPFDARELRSKAYDEMQRIIREVDPPKPSTKLSAASDTIASLAAHRSIEPAKLRAKVRGELDWIVMKCLEKDRKRRYETASSLAIDIQHHLADEPVSAGAPSQAYKIQKFMRRHRGPVIAAAIILIVLIAGVIGTSIGLVGQARQRKIADQQRVIAEQQRAEAVKQEEEARNQAAIADAVGQFQGDMLASADPDKMLGDKVTVLQAIQGALKELDGGKLKDKPLVEAAVRATIGNTLRNLGRYNDAEPQLRKALELRRTAATGSGKPDLYVAQSLSDLAELVKEQGKPLEAQTLLREALALKKQALSEDAFDVGQEENNLALVELDLGQFEEAERLVRDALKIFHRIDPTPQYEVAMARNNLGLSLKEQGKLGDAELCFRESLEIVRRILPVDHPQTMVCISNLSWALEGEGKYAEAEQLCRDAVRVARQVYPAGHPRIAVPLSGLGLLLLNRGRNAEAETTLREALDIRRKALPSPHRDLEQSLGNLGGVLQAQGKYPEAEAAFREALDVTSRALPAGHPDIARATNNLALLLHDEGNLHEAEAMFRSSLEMYRKAMPPGHEMIAASLNNLALTLEARGAFAEAEQLYREALELARKALPPGHPKIAMALGNLGAVIADQGRYAESDPPLREALELFRKSNPQNERRIADTLGNLAGSLQAQGKLSDAEPLFREALDLMKKCVPPEHPDLARTMNNLGLALRDECKYHEAELLFRSALEICRKSLPPAHQFTGLVLNNLGLVVQAQGDLLQAEPLFREAVEICTTSYPPEHPVPLKARFNFANLLLEQGKLSDAQTIHRQVLEVRRKAAPVNQQDIGMSLVTIGRIKVMQERYAEAEPLYHEALEHFEKVLEKSHWLMGGVRLGLGRALTGLKRWPEAEVALSAAEPVLATAQGVPPGKHDDCVRALVALYTAWDKSEPDKGYGDRALSWQSRLPSPATAPTPAQAATQAVSLSH